MSNESFAGYLAGLDEESLIALLQARPDVRVEPTPRNFTQLAQRLSGADSLGMALRGVSKDAWIVGQAITVLGESATVPMVARLFRVREQIARDAVAELFKKGLAWQSEGILRQSERLGSHWSVEVGGNRPLAKIAGQVLADDLRAAAEALGIAIDGLRKPELIAQLSETMANPHAMASVLAKLPKSARKRLEELRLGYFDDDHYYDDYHPNYRTPYLHRTDVATEQLVKAGVVLLRYGQPELPTEMAVAAWLADPGCKLTGKPKLSAIKVDKSVARSAAQAAAQEALRSVTTLLDEAQLTPIVELKKGGIGLRERTRLATLLAIPHEAITLWIDLSFKVGLLGRGKSGYAPTAAYMQWRAAEPGTRWAALADAWFWLAHSPTYRENLDGQEVSPPLAVESVAGPLRRTLLSVTGSGTSAQAVGTEIDWFVPLPGYETEHRAETIKAVLREAELLGIIVSDALSELGEHLLEVTSTAQQNPVAELARLCAPLLPHTPCSVLVQSDLTAVVSGQPSVAVAQLLSAAAVSEARGAAGVWRFTSDSVRAALDSGWQAADLLDQLQDLANNKLPQPLVYLINDVARRHGEIRVREVRSCIVAQEQTITEILHTKSLTKLGFSQLAPTVLSSPHNFNDILAKLRAVGLYPMAENADGSVVVEKSQEHQATASYQSVPMRARTEIPAAELAKQLFANPHGTGDLDKDESATFQQLTQLNSRLDEAELLLLADAIDRNAIVLISYRDKNGSRTIREIQPNQLYGKWLDSWCYLRNGQRDFTVANIESVAPAR